MRVFGAQIHGTAPRFEDGSLHRSGCIFGEASTHCPEVAVIDILMSDLNGLEVQTRLQCVSPSTRVIVLTAKDNPSVRRKAIIAGASAFYIKFVERGEFLAGIKAATESSNEPLSGAKVP